MNERKKKVLALDSVLAGGKGVSYLLRDDFTADLAAGAVHNTAATPGGLGGATLNTRSVTDTESKITVASGWLVFAGGKATPAHGDPRLSYGTSARTVGRVATWCVRVNQRDKDCYVGLNINNTQNPIRAHAINFTSGSKIALYDNNGVDTTAYKNYQPYGEYLIAILQRADGATYLVRAGNTDYPTWTLLKTTALNSSANLFVQCNNHAAAFSVKSVRLTSTLLNGQIDAGAYNVLNKCVRSFGTHYFFAVGDSRTLQSEGDNKWVGLLTRYSQGNEFQTNVSPLAGTGWKIADVQAGLAAKLAAATTAPEFVWIDIGINDNGITAEADFKTSFLAVLDAINAKWPSAPIYVDNVAKLTVDTTDINNWIDYCIAQRSTFTHAGTDERDYATGNMQVDNVHFTDAGYKVKADAILAVLGYAA